MPTLVVGMLDTRESYDMPTTSVGMAPFPSTFRNRNELGIASPELIRMRGKDGRRRVSGYYIK